MEPTPIHDAVEDESPTCGEFFGFHTEHTCVLPSHHSDPHECWCGAESRH